MKATTPGALETAKKPNVAAEIRRLTWLSFPPLEDTQGMRGQAVRILANRLASGEIDVAEYERLRDALHRTSGSPRT